MFGPHLHVPESTFGVNLAAKINNICYMGNKKK